ncbi:uncharacterized protein LOC143526504 [Brachyhypopomus gauderio]|uniref:uncharacterized protein LOC143526504 n=1 Tax=Brachyhypopomus gauderio TaxID=698409 RepID=UPI004042DDB5
MWSTSSDSDGAKTGYESHIESIRAACLRYRWQDVNEREHKAQLTNQKLLRDFQRAERTLGELVVRAEAMSTIQVHYERYLEENVPQWHQTQRDKSLSELHKNNDQQLKTCTLHVEEIQTVGGGGSPNAMFPDSSHLSAPPTMHQPRPHTSYHKDKIASIINRNIMCPVRLADEHMDSTESNVLVSEAVKSLSSEVQQQRTENRRINTWKNRRKQTHKSAEEKRTISDRSAEEKRTISDRSAEEKRTISDRSAEEQRTISDRSCSSHGQSDNSKHLHSGKAFAPKLLKATQATVRSEELVEIPEHLQAESESESERVQGTCTRSSDAEEKRGVIGYTRKDVTEERGQSQGFTPTTERVSDGLVRDIREEEEVAESLDDEEWGLGLDGGASSEEDTEGEEDEERRSSVCEGTCPSEKELHSWREKEAEDEEVDDDEEEEEGMGERASETGEWTIRREEEERESAGAGSDGEEEESESAGTGSDVEMDESESTGTGSDVEEDESESTGTGSDVEEDESESTGTGSDVEEDESESAGTGSDGEEDESEFAGTGSDVEEDESESAGTGSDVEEAVSTPRRHIHDSFKESYEDDTEDEQLQDQELEDGTEDDDDVVLTPAYSRSCDPANDDTKFEDDDSDEGLLTPQIISQQHQLEEPEETLKPGSDDVHVPLSLCCFKNLKTFWGAS